MIDAAALENHMWVNKGDVVPLNDEEGLVRLIDVYESDAERSLVGINDVGDMRVSRVYVPNSEIVWR